MKSSEMCIVCRLGLRILMYSSFSCCPTFNAAFCLFLENVTDDTKKIVAYQELISKLPPPHSCLLMYLLDLLSLFAHHSDENLMDSKNLASVFQPGVLSHPSHALSPGEYMTSAAVLKFLIDNQSSFTLPQPNIDDDDDEMVNFGLAGTEPSRPNPVTFKSSHYHGGFVNAADHERLYEQPGLEDTTALDTGIKRQLSLHKPILEHATLPGNTINRSKSTNSSISSRHSQSGKLSSNFLARRRSNRNSKTSSKVFAEHDGLGSEDKKEHGAIFNLVSMNFHLSFKCAGGEASGFKLVF